MEGRRGALAAKALKKLIWSKSHYRAITIKYSFAAQRVGEKKKKTKVVMEYFGDPATLMDEDEMALNVWGPLSSGALQSNPAFEENKSGSGKASAGFAAAEPGEPQPMDSNSGLGGDQGDAGNIADGIDDFLDNFLVLAGSEPGSETDGMKIPEGDLDFAWLDNFDDLPSPSSPISEIAVSCASRENVSSLEDLSLAAVLSVKPPERELTPAAAEAAVSAAAEAAVSAAAEAASAPIDPVACGALAQPYDGGLSMVAPSATSAADGEGDGTGRYITVERAIPRRDITIDEGGGYALMNRGETRQAKIARYLAKRNRRCWTKASSYESRKKVANGRPRHKGRFLPLVSDFIPIAELQRRQRAMMKEMQEKAARADQEACAWSESVP